MPTFKSKAEERRYGPRFDKRLAAMNAASKREAEIAVAESAVIEEVMADWRAGLITNTSTYAACAALAKLEAK